MLKPTTHSPSAFLSCAAGAMALGGLSLVAAAALLVVQNQGSSTSAKASAPTPESCFASCQLPEGIDWGQLSTEAADDIALRSQLCADLACGRIDHVSYTRALERLELEQTEPLPTSIWAQSVRAVSSQYGSGTDSWSAASALGQPDVFPRDGDNGSAWASVTSDGKSEFIEVGIAPTRLSGIDVYETYNPGSIRSIEIVTESGVRQRVFTGEPSVRVERSRIEHSSFPCSKEKVIGIRVTMDTGAVPGWNEIDAIGGTPCR